MRRFVLAAFALTVLAACQPEVVPLSDEDVAAVRGIGTSYAQAVLAEDAGSVAALYAEDGVEMPPDAHSIEGRAAIQASYEVVGPTPHEFTLTSVEIDGWGETAVDRGNWHWVATPEDSTEQITLTGKYIAIARKQEDGSWLWSAVIYNGDMPLPTPDQQ